MSNRILIKAQEILKIPVTGVSDEFTEAAIRNYQLMHSLMVSGDLDKYTLESLGLDSISEEEDDNTTRRPEPEEEVVVDTGVMDTDQIKDVPIHKYYLPKGQYYEGPTPKWSLFLHHTAGWHNPYQQVDIWAKDPQGPIATQYVIGGPNASTGDKRYDGEIVQCFSDQNYAWHLTIGNTAVHRNSIGIEMCNFGYLTKGGYTDLKSKKWIDADPNSFYTWTGLKIQPAQVVDLEFKFRGYRYFHKYSANQLESLKFLVNFIEDKIGINIYSGIYQRLKKKEHPAKAFEYWEDAKFGKIKGMFCHSSVVAVGKWDLAPQPDLIDMILTL